MDFELNASQQSLKRQFEEFFRHEAKRAPKDWFWGSDQAYESDEGWAYHRSVAKKLAEKGWLALSWPEEFGGMGYGPVEQLLFNEVRLSYRVPGVDTYGPTQVAASIMAYGSDEQKREWLPRIANGEISWCQGWSEPNAGSDLASLMVSAVEDSDNFIINGQKIWTSGAHRATHIFILARTDFDAPKKHKGITYFLSEMDKPGIEVRPVYSFSGTHSYNEVFFDDLRIPKHNVLGPVNQGWYVMLKGIEFERIVTIRRIAEAMKDLEELVQFCHENHRNGKLMAKDKGIRERLAKFAVEFEVVRQWAYFTAWQQSKGRSVISESSALRYYANELLVRFHDFGLEILGLYGTLKNGSPWAKLQGKYEYLCQNSAKGTLGGGTTETMKNVIAWLGLKLPRL